MKIYLDVLIITNAVITFMYLSGLSRITHSEISKRRIILASMFGAFSSLIVLTQTKNYLEAVIITVVKLALIMLTIIIAFKWRGFRKLFRYFFLYITFNFIFAGCSLLLWQVTGSKIIYVKNFTVYFNISLLTIIIATIFAYILITIYDLITSHITTKSEKYKIKYTLGNYEIVLPAIADTGNILCDTFTGTPVVVMHSNELFDHFNLELTNQYELNGFRLIPFSTINGSGLISVTAKGNIQVIDEKNSTKDLKCYVGITRSDKEKSRAIFNPSLLI